MNTMYCKICKNEFTADELITGHGIRHEIEDLIKVDIPTWNDNDRICKNDFDQYLMKYISNIIKDEKGTIEELESAVIRSIEDNEIISMDFGPDNEVMKMGDRIADKVASFGGSWTFIILFFSILLGWIVINSLLFLYKPFDPYPYILLNLILSCLASIQAPIIMMSQNRQELKDRLRAENDYKINLKSEIEVRTLHEKVDHLLLDQWSKMMQIQEMQIEILEEIRNKIK